MNQQPEALHWAEWLDDLFASDGEPKAAAAELRRLHEENKWLNQMRETVVPMLRAANEAFRTENESLKSELQEQARVNGMGGERELRLMAENEALRKDATQALGALNHLDEHTYIDDYGNYSLLEGFDSRLTSAAIAALKNALEGQS